MRGVTFSYRRRPTNNVARVGMNYLSDLVIRPGIEKCFGPLLLYRGRMNRGHAHRLWNFALLMMAAEAETLADGLRLANNEAFAQLCGPVHPPIKVSLNSYFWRLADNPAVTNNINGFTEYVKSLEVHRWHGLERVDRFTDRINCAEWRISTHKNAGQDYRDRERGVPESQQLFYPYMLHDPEKLDDGKALVLLVSNAVPAYWHDSVRADVCQEMVMSLLSGDITPGQLHDHVRQYITKHYKANPLYWEDGTSRRSLSAPVSASDARTIGDFV